LIKSNSSDIGFSDLDENVYSPRSARHFFQPLYYLSADTLTAIRNFSREEIQVRAVFPVSHDAEADLGSLLAGYYDVT
jgi:hypothetical protein